MIYEDDITQVYVSNVGDDVTATVSKGGRVVVIERDLFLKVLRKAFPDITIVEEQ
jgi:hypothetical protein